jgi:hypothetical protein
MSELKYPLIAPSVKIDRARKHLAELEAETAAFLKANPIQFLPDHEHVFKGALFSFTLRFPPVPLALGAVLGDVIHNLRTALDLTASDLARINGASPEGVYFPFCEDADFLDSMIKRRNFDRAGSDAVALLKELKPYRGGNVALRALHEMDVEDKHKALIPNLMSVGSPIIQMWEDDGTPNPRVIGDPNAPSSVEFVFPAGLGLDGREIVPTLHEMVKLVEDIVEAFRALANRNA